MIKINSYSKWLMSLIVLITIMVLVGGLTRLTGSGLSMVDWRPVYGILPPLSLSDWQDVFNQYKQFPEYQLKNFNMTLDEFKVIFYWEYIHRILGRIIGLTGLIPLIYFIIKNKLSNSEFKQSIIINVWIIIQGIVGWYMVKSGLVENPNVSHFRLAFHLSLAFSLYAYLWYCLSKFIKSEPTKYVSSLIKKVIYTFIGLVTIQLIYGAFVAGLKAGYLYPNFPKMGAYWISPEALNNESIIAGLIKNSFMIQFIHRSIAWVILISSLIVAWIIRKQQNLNHLLKIWKIITGVILLQFILGVATLLSKMNILIASWHQMNALILIALLSYVVFNINQNQTN